MIDSSNFTIAIVGYVIVFLALLILYIVFANLPKLLKVKSYLSNKKRSLLENNGHQKEYVAITGQENAAIATAIYMYLYQMHDEENTTITIKKVKKDYTPWSSKIHSMNNQLPR